MSEDIGADRGVVLHVRAYFCGLHGRHGSAHIETWKLMRRSSSGAAHRGSAKIQRRCEAFALIRPGNLSTFDPCRALVARDRESCASATLVHSARSEAGYHVRLENMDPKLLGYNE